MKRRQQRLLLPFGLVFYIGWHLLTGRPFLEGLVFRTTSPDGRYSLRVYNRFRLFAPPGDGTPRKHVVVCNRWGFKIGASRPGCEDFGPESPAEIRWGRDQVEFQPARSINLKTGACED